MRRLGIILLGTVLSFSQLLYAQQISESEAKDKALSFFANHTKAGGDVQRSPQRGGSNQITLAYTAGNDNANFFYVYNNGDNDGYLIVGGDERAREILAYVPKGHFNYDKLHDNMKWLLGKYEHEIDTAIIINTKMPVAIPKMETATHGLSDISDMITTKWNQGEPYNNAIPAVIDGGITYHSPTGCVPTALAQIMNYWKYPTQGIGSKSYTWNYSDIDQSITYSADFANTTYDWSNMLDQYVEGQYTTAQADAVSTLMYHIGVALQVLYGKNGTSYSHFNEIDDIVGIRGLMHDLPAYFGYDEGMQLVSRGDFTLDQWKTLLYNELSAGRPVYYEGDDLKGGHSFVCHGYSSDLDMFSFNWGWGGLEDGYFALSGTDAVNGFTATSEGMLIGIRPKGHNPGMSELVFGDRFMADGIWYKVWDEKNKLVEVTHTTIRNQLVDPELADPDYCAGNVIIPSQVQHGGIDYTVSRIGVYAFCVCTNGQANIRSVSLPPTITSLGKGAFFSSSYLSDSLIIPDAVEIIPDNCFSYSSSLPYVNIPSSVKSIGSAAFFLCKSLQEEISLPEGCYNISPGAFQECYSLQSVEMPSTMRSIGFESFSGTSLVRMIFHCDSFVSVSTYMEGNSVWGNFSSPFPSSIENGVLYVPADMVNEYRNTNDPYWSKWGAVESIDNLNLNIGKTFVVDEFKYMIMNDSCVSLKAVTTIDYSKNCMIVPSVVSYEGNSYNVVSLAAGAFTYQGYGVRGIDKLILSEGITDIGDKALQDCGFKYIELPNSLEKIGNAAFNLCYQLESLDIPGSVKVAQGLQQCGSLKQVILHEGTQYMGAYFLNRCPKLKEVMFPSSIRYYAGGTIVECDSLSSIVSLTDKMSLESLDGWFGLGFGSNHESVNLFVPEPYLSDKQSDYNKNDPWTDFPNKLKYVALESFEISDTVDIVVNEQGIIPCQFFPNNASYRQLKWRSSDEEIVMVNCEGYVYAKSEGEVTVTASSVDGSNIVRSCVVRVNPNGIPSKASDYCVYQPKFRYQSNPTLQQDQDTISFDVTSESGELYLAFNLYIPQDGGSLCFCMGNQKYDIIPTGDMIVILHFDNIREQDILRMIWNANNKVWGGHPYMEISNIRAWDPARPTYVLSYYIDGVLFQTESLKYGNTIVPASDPTKEGYTFSGWSEIPTTMPAHNVIVTGSFTINNGIICIEPDDSYRVYDLTGKFLGEMTDEDLKLLKPSVYIVNKKKLRVK